MFCDHIARKDLYCWVFLLETDMSGDKLMPGDSVKCDQCGEVNDFEDWMEIELDRENYEDEEEFKMAQMQAMPRCPEEECPGRLVNAEAAGE